MKLLKQRVKSALESFGYRICRTTADLSYSPFPVFRQLFRNKSPGTILDIGGHHGETAAKLAAMFPDSRIHSFEPSPQNFPILQSNLRRFPQTIPVNLALGDREESRILHQNRFSPTTSLLNNIAQFNDHATAQMMETVSEATIPVQTLDGYCREQGIEFVDLLKLDVQGFELHVLRGAAKLFSEQKVAVIYTEVLFEELYQGQAPFIEVYAFLSKAGFKLNNLYEQSHSSSHSLRWCDALFIHPGRYEKFIG